MCIFNGVWYFFSNAVYLNILEKFITIQLLSTYTGFFCMDKPECWLYNIISALRKTCCRINWVAFFWELLSKLDQAHNIHVNILQKLASWKIKHFEPLMLWNYVWICFIHPAEIDSWNLNRVSNSIFSPHSVVVNSILLRADE